MEEITAKIIENFSLLEAIVNGVTNADEDITLIQSWKKVRAAFQSVEDSVNKKKDELTKSIEAEKQALEEKNRKLEEKKKLISESLDLIAPAAPLSGSWADVEELKVPKKKKTWTRTVAEDSTAKAESTVCRVLLWLTLL